jgi:hypothetical protein
VWRSGRFVVRVDRRSTENVGGFGFPRWRGLACLGDASGARGISFVVDAVPGLTGLGAGITGVGVDFVPDITGILFWSIRRLRRNSRPAGVFKK